jgi:hypothetical protein
MNRQMTGKNFFDGRDPTDIVILIWKIAGNLLGLASAGWQRGSRRTCLPARRRRG